MTALGRRDWVPQASEDYIQRIAGETATQPLDAIAARIDALTAENRAIHERDCVNLNPATNVMNPRAEALLAAGIPTVEIHISNVHAREDFRRHSYVSRVAKAVICGFGINGYVLAIDGLAAMLHSSKG